MKQIHESSSSLPLASQFACFAGTLYFLQTLIKKQKTNRKQRLIKNQLQISIEDYILVRSFKQAQIQE